uniref:Uncharacterized protein n=1 Tax=Glossina austeni TaxID=7395 RepID=A0A1A9UGF7_GLOAU
MSGSVEPLCLTSIVRPYLHKTSALIIGLDKVTSVKAKENSRRRPRLTLRSFLSKMGTGEPLAAIKFHGPNPLIYSYLAGWEMLLIVFTASEISQNSEIGQITVFFFLFEVILVLTLKIALDENIVTKHLIELELSL